MPQPRALAEIMFGPPVPGRECGSCTACCKLPEIDLPELKKPADMMCPNCTGEGCEIYEARPSVCRTYYCIWRRIGALPESARPDRLGVMLHFMNPKPARNLLARRYIKAQAVKFLGSSS
jgi:hypothetical protein